MRSVAVLVSALSLFAFAGSVQAEKKSVVSSGRVTQETINSVRSLGLVDPTQITYYSNESFDNERQTYVALIASYTDLGVMKQNLIVNIGRPDELYQLAFIVPFYGFIQKDTVGYSIASDNSLVVSLIVYGEEINGGFSDAKNTEVKIVLPADQNADTGFSNTLYLTKTVVDRP